MIRHRHGNEFFLIAQHDHAQLAGKFATHLGNEQFSAPSPYGETVAGIALHDCGWPLHDESPTLNAKGLPLHVLESPMSVVLPVWTESARKSAAENGPYTGLLVSLHQLALSSIAKTNDPTPHERAQSQRDLFELNKFQHRQVEHQENLRRQLGTRTDIPLKQGFAKPGTSPVEDLLLFNFNLLKAMDRLSLDLCCSEDLFQTVEGVFPRPGISALTLTFDHPGEGSIAVSPWPFNQDRLEYTTACRRVPAREYADVEEFRRIYGEAPVDAYSVRVSPT
jgi:hypothetical protein